MQFLNFEYDTFYYTLLFTVTYLSKKACFQFFYILGGLSSDILALQHQSSQLGLRLINRQAVQQCSSQIIDDLIIPENLIRFEIIVYNKRVNYKFKLIDVFYNFRDLLEIPVTEPAFSDQLLVLQTKLVLSGEHHHCSKAAQVHIFYILVDKAN